MPLPDTSLTAKAVVFLPSQGRGLSADEKLTFFNDCEQGDVTAISTTLQRCPAAVHYADEDGQTPLHLAVAWAKIEAVEVLMQNGVPLHEQDNRGQSATDLANRLGYEGIASMIANEHEGRETRAAEKSAAAQKEAVLRDAALFTQGLPTAVATHRRPIRFKS